MIGGFRCGSAGGGVIDEVGLDSGGLRGLGLAGVVDLLSLHRLPVMHRSEATCRYGQVLWHMRIYSVDCECYSVGSVDKVCEMGVVTG